MEFRFSQFTDVSRVEVSRSALLHNLKTIKGIVGERVGVAAVVKACAYGHGYTQIAEILKDEGIRFFAVHSIDEAATLAKHDDSLPIMILGYVPLGQLQHAVENEWRLTVFNIETIDRLTDITRDNNHKAFVHLKLETGTNRQGIRRTDLPDYIEAARQSDGIVIEGVSMHFANIEDTTDHSFAKMQIECYNLMLDDLKSMNVDIPIRHTASSAASLLFVNTHFDMIRFGISMYGLWPSKETYLSYMLSNPTNSLLKPVLSWKTIVSQIKDVPAGEYIGYGCTYRTTTDSRIAVIPVGYFDGYDRKLSNLAHVLIRGKRAPVRGRICMDMFMADVTHIPDAKLEDEVVLIGDQGQERISADQLADWAGTINYEIVSRINPLLPRTTVD
jgi:alanine racemase